MSWVVCCILYILCCNSSISVLIYNWYEYCSAWNKIINNKAHTGKYMYACVNGQDID